MKTKEEKKAKKVCAHKWDRTGVGLLDPGGQVFPVFKKCRRCGQEVTEWVDA